MTMGELPREAFVPPHLRGSAYVDEDLPIGDGRFLMEPMVLARLVQALDITANDVALDVGCGTGYSAAVLARIATTVVAIESDSALIAKASGILSSLGVDNVVMVEGQLAAGYPCQAPYDVIFVDGAIPTVPRALFDQLAEGGRLAAVVVASGAFGKATLFAKKGGIVGGRILFDANVAPLAGFKTDAEFVF